MDAEKWTYRAKRAEHEAHRILAIHEKSPSRIILLDDLTKSLSGTPVDVQDFFREAIACLQNGLFRAAVVTAWAGHFHMFSETLYHNHETDIRACRSKWNFKDLNELKESYAESQILDVGKEVKFINKANLRVLQGQLSIRNQCAHPTLYKPSMNASIGYVDELIHQTLSYLSS